jgi:hypothetical protein
MGHLVIHKLVPPNETLLWYVHNQEDLMLSMSLMNCAPPSNHVFMCVVLSLLSESHPPSPFAGLLHRSISEAGELRAIMMKNVLGMMI